MRQSVNIFLYSAVDISGSFADVRVSEGSGDEPQRKLDRVGMRPIEADRSDTDSLRAVVKILITT
jgi:hypothetical protein